VGNRRSSESVRDWTSNLRGSPCELGLDSCEPIENIDVLGDTVRGLISFIQCAHLENHAERAAS